MAFQDKWKNFRAKVGAAIAPKDIDDGWLDGVTLYGRNLSGVKVTPMKSLQNSAVLACCRIISESVASLPLILYRRLDKGKDRARENTLYDLLRYEPNPEMTAQQFFETSALHQLLWGNSYAEIDNDGRGRIQALWPRRPDRVSVQRNKTTQEIEYKIYNTTGGYRTIPYWKMFHIPFFSLDGITGISQIGLARMSVGLSVAAEEYGASFFGNGATPQFILEHPGVLGEDAAKRLKKSWNESHQGTAKAHGVQVLEEGLTVKTLSLPPNDSQFLETRKYQVEEIARIYRVPPHMLAAMDKATFSNIEHQSLEFVQHSLRPWLTRWEQNIHKQLLLTREKKEYFAEFLVDGLLRGDISSRYSSYQTAKMSGWMSSNDIREKENMDLIDGGDDYWQPLNMVPVSEYDRFNEEDTRETGKRSLYLVEERSRITAIAGRRRATLAWRRILKDSSDRILKKEVADLRKLLKEATKQRSMRDFENQLDTYYDDRFEQFAYTRMYGTMLSYGEEITGYAAEEIGDERENVMDDTYLQPWVKRYTNAYISRHVEKSKREMADALHPEDPNFEKTDEDIESNVNAKLESWEETRATVEGKAESVRLNGAISHRLWALAGVLSMRWKSYGDSCPYCKGLNGMVVGIDDRFLQAGVSFGGDEEAGILPLVPLQSKQHPPAHEGCDCGIEAVI